MECRNSSLCIFDKEAFQTDFQGYQREKFFPSSPISGNSPIEFLINGSSEEYLDLNTIYVELELKIVKKGGKAIAPADKVALVNLPLSSIFSDVLLTVGTQQIEGGDGCYPYKSYMSVLMNSHPAAQTTHMIPMGWIRDQAGRMDDEANTGLLARGKWTEKSKSCFFYGPLYLDFFRQNRKLISQTDVRLKFFRSKPEFCLMGHNSTSTDFHVNIKNMTLDVKRDLINPSVINGHASGLQSRNAIYPLHHTAINTFTISPGHTSFIKDNLFPSETPKLLLLGMVENEAFNGKLALNPFHFQHFNMNKLALYVNGKSFPGRPFEPKFAEGNYLRDYVMTMDAFGYFNSDDTNGLTLKEFANGYTIYAFDLTPDHNAGGDTRYANPAKGLRVELGFETPLKDTINVILFALFSSDVEVTLLRDVITNYTK